MEAAQRYLLFAIRTWFGAFNLMSGLNYFLHLFPLPKVADPSGGAYVEVTLQLGLFQMAKIIELVTGTCILFDLFTPLALVVLFPVTINVFYLNAIISGMPHIQMSGTRGLVFHLILFAAYAKYYYPLLRLKAERQPIWDNYREIPGSF